MGQRPGSLSIDDCRRSARRGRHRAKASEDTIDAYFRAVMRHPAVPHIRLRLDEARDPRNSDEVTDQDGKDLTPILSQGDLNALALAIFLGLASAGAASELGFVMLDDPSQSLGPDIKDNSSRSSMTSPGGSVYCWPPWIASSTPWSPITSIIPGPSTPSAPGPETGPTSPEARPVKASTYQRLSRLHARHGRASSARSAKVVRDWLMPVPPIEPFDLPVFAVNRRPGGQQPARAHDNKVFIAALWRMSQGEPNFPRLSLPEFKQRLLEANGQHSST